ncbi:MAG: DUF5615 family PIN-like protein [Elusimicrobia bacterium]|nr:DUF5615 family PIN-like protein [Elusimicrobiota bacterium]
MSKILADENIHIVLINELIKNGHDVKTVADKKLLGASDRIVLEVANSEKRILLTADKDFGGILEMGPLFGKGRILLLRYKIFDFKRIGKELIFVISELKEEFEQKPGLLVVLSEGRYRVHKPISEK